MLKPLLIVASALVVLAGCAAPESRPDSVAKAPAAARLNCLSTGTRIALKPGECANGAGRVFTKDDLDRTGAIDPLEALRRLDPSIR